MPVQIVVPQLGESIVEATVSEWLKQPGQQVAVGDPVVRLETDKVDLEVGAEQAGVLARIERQAGEDVKVGDVLGVIESEPSQRIGGGNDRAAAVIRDAGLGEAAKVQPGGDLGHEGPGAAGQNRDAAANTPRAKDTEPAADITPVARRVAEELGVDPARVPGSGPKGRVTKEDVESYAQQAAPAVQEAPAAQITGAPTRPAPGRAPAQEPSRTMTTIPAPDGQAGAETGRREVRQRMSRRRQTIARRLVEAQHTAAMLTTFNEIDMTAVMDVRKRRRDNFKERHGVNLGFTSFFVKASIGALKAFPRLNAEIQGNDIILKQYYDIGIAVGAEEGLVVPVLRDADRMSFSAIETAVKDFATKATQGTLSLEDLAGGTFTITNGGVFGSLMSTPILNPPQVGILGLHKIEDRPVVRDGQVVVRPMMYVALSYDHRIVDGREAVQFLVRVKELIEDPETLLIEG
jgi:2-oxoglutarate dehydrogenase E2 component (dihydrolipoamide succinyltransferase)